MPLELTDALHFQAICQDLPQNSQPVWDLLQCPVWPASGHDWGCVQVPADDRVQPRDWLLLLWAECYGHAWVGAIQEDCWYRGEEFRLLYLCRETESRNKSCPLHFLWVFWSSTFSVLPALRENIRYQLLTEQARNSYQIEGKKKSLKVCEDWTQCFCLWICYQILYSGCVSLQILWCCLVISNHIKSQCVVMHPQWVMSTTHMKFNVMRQYVCWIPI